MIRAFLHQFTDQSQFVHRVPIRGEFDESFRRSTGVDQLLVVIAVGGLDCRVEKGDGAGEDVARTRFFDVLVEMFGHALEESIVARPDVFVLHGEQIGQTIEKLLQQEARRPAVNDDVQIILSEPIEKCTDDRRRGDERE